MSALASLADEVPANDKFNALAQPVAPPRFGCGYAALDYYRHRIYPAQLGRFIGWDPVGYLTGSNLFCYCSADPIRLRDPIGLATVEDDAGNWCCPDEMCKLCIVVWEPPDGYIDQIMENTKDGVSCSEIRPGHAAL